MSSRRRWRRRRRSAFCSSQSHCRRRTRAVQGERESEREGRKEGGREGREVNCEQITRERRRAAAAAVHSSNCSHEFRLGRSSERREGKKEGRDCCFDILTNREEKTREGRRDAAKYHPDNKIGVRKCGTRRRKGRPLRCMTFLRRTLIPFCSVSLLGLYYATRFYPICPIPLLYLQSKFPVVVVGGHMSRRIHTEEDECKATQFWGFPAG